MQIQANDTKPTHIRFLSNKSFAITKRMTT